MANAGAMARQTQSLGFDSTGSGMESPLGRIVCFPTCSPSLRVIRLSAEFSWWSYFFALEFSNLHESNAVATPFFCSNEF